MKKVFLGIGIALAGLTIVGVGTGLYFGLKPHKPEKTEEKTDEYEDDERYFIYLKAREAGYTGTYEEWLNSIRGASIQLQVSDGFIQMRYSNETNWTNLVSLSSLTGSNGQDGKTTELKLTNENVLWKYTDESDNSWRLLFSLSTITGTNGKEIELSTNAEYVLWKYVGDNNWKNLISLETLKGNKGDDGKSAYDIAVELGYTGSASDWLESLKGLKGDNGKEIELSTNGDYLVWRYVGDSNWNNLVSLISLKGDKGDDGKSAYEIYLKYHPEYTKTEEEWIEDLVNGNLANIEEYTVKFMVDDSEINSIKVKSGRTITKPNDPEKPGYRFIGWYIDDEKWFFSSNPVYNNITLVAKFEINNYNVTINGETDSYSYNTEITLPTIPNTSSLVYEGYLDSDNNFYEFESVYTVTKEDTLTLKSHHKMITFDAGDGNVDIESLEVTTGETTQELPSARKEGFKFKGWMYNDTLYIDPFTYEFDSDVVFTAVYEENSNTDYQVVEHDDYVELVSYNGDSNEVVIPEEIDGKPVTTLKSTLLSNNKNVTKLTIPSSVTTVENGLLEGQTNFETLVFSGNLTNSTLELFNVTSSDALPESFDKIELIDFYRLSTTFFTNDNRLYDVTIAEGATEIATSAFNGCTNIKSVNIPNGVTKIGPSAFRNCTQLSTINIPEGVTEIGYYSFYNCNNIYRITLPSTLKTLNKDAFKDCNYIAEIYNLSNKDIIQYSSTYGDLSYNVIAIHKNINDETSLVIEDDFLFAVKDQEGYVVKYLGDNANIVIPSSFVYNRTNINTLYIKVNAFKSNTTIKNVVISEGITKILNNAFMNCSNLENITIPSTISLIDNYVFYGCTKLDNVTIPNSVTYIGSYAFYKCQKLTSIIIPEGIKYIHDQTFAECYKLTEITIPSSLESWSSSTYELSYTLYFNGTIEQWCNITINETLTEFATKFYIYDSAGSVIHNGKTYSPLTRLDVPSTITSIGVNQFRGMKDLSVVVIPSSVTRIEGNAFKNCNNLVNVTLPSTINYIGYSAFAGTKIKSMTIPNSVTTIDYDTFNGCYDLQYVTIPNSVINIMSYAFNNCSSLSSITIPNSVIEIGEYAFNGCYSLTSVTIPKSVISIGYSLFEACNYLETITYQGTTSEWNSITKPDNWIGNYCPIKKVVCTNGDINIQ